MRIDSVEQNIHFRETVIFSMVLEREWESSTDAVISQDRKISGEMGIVYIFIDRRQLIRWQIKSL